MTAMTVTVLLAHLAVLSGGHTDGKDGRGE